jgi:putative phosphoribosyl transferase
MRTVFADRRDAGMALAQRLSGRAFVAPLVVALPRGGVPVAYEIARALGAPLDVLVVRKLGASGNPELGVGAIAEGGVAVIDAAAVARAGMSEAALAEVMRRERDALRAAVARYRGTRPRVPVRARTAIAVDDGLATGLTALAAIRALRGWGGARVIVAVPVGAGDSIAMLAAEADEVIAHTVPTRLRAVGYWYRDFAPVSDEEVLELLASSREGA